MSTKTLRKRIALVAVSALGFGLLSAVPSSAATVTGTVSPVRYSETSGTRVTMGIYTQVLDNEIDDVGLLLQKAAGF